MAACSHRFYLPPLHRAAARGDVPLVEKLLADFEVEESFGARRPMEWACCYGQVEVVRLLLDRGASGCVTENGEDFYEGASGPIHLAVMSDSVPLVELLLSRGVPLDEADLYGATPLHLAGSVKMARWLIAPVMQNTKWGIEAATSEGLTPLHYAASDGRSAVLRCLLEAGANPRHDDCEAGRPPLHRAARKRHLNACAVLLQAGVDINALDMYEGTALDEALTYARWCDANPHISLAIFTSWMLERGAKATKFSYHQIAEMMRFSFLFSPKSEVPTTAWPVEPAPTGSS